MLKLGVALAVLAPALASAGADTVCAQQLRGRLLDLNSNEPLPAGLVTLVAGDGRHLITAVSDGGGYWALEVPRPGSYYVAAKRIGYQPWMAGPVEVKPGDDLNSVFHLRRAPVLLGPIEVTAEAMRQYLELRGFYDRQRADFGHYVTPEESGTTSRLKKSRNGKPSGSPTC